MKTCKYCTMQFKTIEELRMHELNCKCNPYYHAKAIDKNNFVYPLHDKRSENE